MSSDNAKNAKLVAVLRGNEFRQASQGLRQVTPQAAPAQGPVKPTHTASVHPQQTPGWVRGRSLDEGKAIRPVPSRPPTAQQTQQAAAQKAEQLRSQQPKTPERAPQKGREPSR